MIGLSTLRQAIAGYLELQAVKKHGSRLGRHLAPVYTEYFQRCRSEFGGNATVAPEIERAVQEFQQKGFTSFLTSETQRLADSIFARIKEEERSGGQIWNDDDR